MRVIIKGGVWKNTEDEILKAAVMKYGKNQWARISSLLVRKTPKQCKARWFEWLDPSIKKTEWSKEEDEKLLHLAKLMPTQWRTIAPIVGRTPAQCLERYQRLLDEAEAEDEEAAPTGDEVRRLRPGEIDPDPETKPARPDPIDMDEDEKEMLSEARARLANTQGKKAKRKAREKQLEEARRLANIQKRRELRAAGIDIKHRKKIRHMDYNADIPFHAQAPAGFFDISEEEQREKRNQIEFKEQRLQRLEGETRDEREEKLRKDDAKRQKQKKSTGDFVDPNSLMLAKNVDLLRSERKRLNLPAPQVSESELAEIVKIGIAGETAKSVVDGSGHNSSNTLLNDYSTLPQSTPMRTPRVPVSIDQIKMQARNLKALSQSQTPLLGESVQLEGNLDFDGVTPRRQNIHATPNPLAAHLTPRGGHQDGKEFSGQTPRTTSQVPPFSKQTPLRDEMGINTPRIAGGSGFEDETPRTQIMSLHQQQANKSQLSSLFKTLPKPKNDFEIVVPDEQENGLGSEDDGEKIIKFSSTIKEDAADRLKREQAEKEAEERRVLARRSQAVQRDLPRPLELSFTLFKELEKRIEEEENVAAMNLKSSKSPSPSKKKNRSKGKQREMDVVTDDVEDSLSKKIESMILEEMKTLMFHDMMMHPVPGQVELERNDEDQEKERIPSLMEIEDEYLEKARTLVKGEYQALLYGSKEESIGMEGHDGDQKSNEDRLLKDVLEERDRLMKNYICVNGSFMKLDDDDENDDIDELIQEAYPAELRLYREEMKKEAMKAAKLEKKVNILLGGYKSRSEKLMNEFQEKLKEYGKESFELNVLRKAQVEEDMHATTRINQLKEQVDYLIDRESRLQQKFSTLMR